MYSSKQNTFLLLFMILYRVCYVLYFSYCDSVYQIKVLTLSFQTASKTIENRRTASLTPKITRLTNFPHAPQLHTRLYSPPEFLPIGCLGNYLNLL